MIALTPVYAVRFSGSSGWKNVDFGTTLTNKIDKLSVKPGITSAIGSFEIFFGDTGSSGEGFTNISEYDDVYIWYGYDATGSSVNFRGKVETIKSELKDGGWTRTTIGRDYGEALSRILDRRTYTGSATQTVKAIRDRAGLDSDNTYIASETYQFNLTQSNEPGFRTLQDISNNPNLLYDFYVDTSKKLHWFKRLTITGSETFSTGVNVYQYRVFKDIGDIKNSYYVFGTSVSGSHTGSWQPTNYDDWTETDSGSWTAWFESGSGQTAYSYPNATNVGGYFAVNNYAIQNYTNISEVTVGNGSYNAHLRFNFTKTLMFNDEDTVRFYYGHGDTPNYMKVTLISNNSLNDVFWTYIECNTNFWNNLTTANKSHIIIPLGVNSEGITTFTGAAGTNTGSYKWGRTGNPDWYNITGIVLSENLTATTNRAIYLYMDGLAFETRFQWATSSAGSITAYGQRDAVISDDSILSLDECLNRASTFLAMYSGSSNQVELVTTGSPALVLGDEYSLTIPSENISNQYYTLIDLEHSIDSDGFSSTCTFSNKKEIRVPIPMSSYTVSYAKDKRDLSMVTKWHTYYWNPFFP